MLKRSLSVSLTLTIVLAVSANAVFAAASCSTWLQQSDGSQWRMCVGDNGMQYCEVAKAGYITRVACG